MKTIKLFDSGPAVEDIQARLVLTGCLAEGAATGVYDEDTAAAVQEFCRLSGLPVAAEVTQKVWSALVDASYRMGDRTLYLRMPYFHGRDVLELQQALGALGFSCGPEDGIFGAYTELALRKFQMNMGLPSDGIAGAYTYASLRNLHHSWEGKEPPHTTMHLGFARASDVLERHALCLFGTDEFTRSVASRMSNLAQATNPVSKIVSAESLLVAPDAEMLLVHVVVDGAAAGSGAGAVGAAGTAGAPYVAYSDDETLSLRLRAAIAAARESSMQRVTVVLPGTKWEDAGEDRSAQHFAITLLDSLCLAL